MEGLWRFVFGNALPVEVEIGPGTGSFLLPSAAGCPLTNFFGIEHSRSRAERLSQAITAHNLPNARVIAADASCIVATLIAPESVAAYHIYFPDPWWKRRHHRRRIFTPPFAAELARTLVPGGCVYVATDVDDVFGLALRALSGCAGLRRDARAVPPRRQLTSFERKGLARGATIRETTFVKHISVGDETGPHTSRAAPITPAESPS